MKTVTCFTHGRAVGNPGAAAIGVTLTEKNGTLISEVAQSIGNSTDTFAAYNAVMIGLQTLVAEYPTVTKSLFFEMRLDNEEVFKQLTGHMPITDPGIVPMFIEIHNMKVAHFPHIKFLHISEVQNATAVRLVTAVLDGA